MIILYKPESIKVLLIGEAPAQNGSYFYKVPEKYPTRNSSIEDDTSMPATIFNHYFGRRGTLGKVNYFRLSFIL
jgi:hypothetical protein